MVNIDDSERVRTIFNAMGAQTLHLVDTFYAPGVVFIDPFHRVEGRDALRDYYRRLYANVQSIHFAFEGETASVNELVLYWTMTCRHPRIAGGAPVSLPGCSRLVFDGQGLVELHRDYFDAGALLYEHLPLLGRVVRYIRERV